MQLRPARDRLPVQDALATCDQHGIYKNGAKEIAAQEGMSLTFMAKYDAREGNSCHIHLSLRGPTASRCSPATSEHGFSPLFEQFLAGQLACLPELTLLLAPNINSYKRYVAGSFAPTAVQWGRDNRTCALRVVGHGPVAAVREPGARRRRQPVPRGCRAHRRRPARRRPGAGAARPSIVGNGYESDRPRVPSTLREAADLFEHSAVARAALGDDVVDHYVNKARIELAAYDAAVTDWERFRGFERL